ncbi:MAG: ABC transporter substrate-binding protein [Chloroflexi bacterium]|nr:ABC transporter substrate-binding protein [Chloroflexota bacterium]
MAKPVVPPEVTESAGTLRIAYTSLGNDGLYPKSSNINAGGKDIQTTMYDVVIGSDAHGTFSTETGLAKSWSMTPDALQHTINLRDGVKFHNGVEVTARDVEFSILEVMEEDSQTSFIRELTPLFENMVVPDPNTLIINCNQPCLFAPWIFSGVRGTEAMVVAKGYYEEVGESEFAKSPIGSGPYKFSSQVLGSSVEVEAIDGSHFRGGIPKYQNITFNGIAEETTRVANLKSGAVDIIDVSRERVDSIAKDGYNMFYKERADLMGAYFFQQWEDDSVFKDKRVREALNLAINREAILEFIFQSRGDMTFYPMGSYGVNSGVDPKLVTYPYNPERAVELLAEAGYDENNPLEVKLAIYPFGGIAEFPRMIEAIAADYEEAGIRVSMQPTEYGTVREMRRAKELGDWVGPWGTTNRGAPAEILSITRALYFGEAPLTTYRNPEFDVIMNQAFGALVEEDVKAQITQMQKFLYDDFAGLPLFEVDTPFATSKEITSWDLGRDSYDKNLDDLIFPAN